MRMMKLMDNIPVRLGLAALLAFKAFDDLFATALTLAYRLRLGSATEGLGQLTPGDDYARLIPLIQAVPGWLHALWVLAGLLYLIAIARLFWRKRGAHILVLAALGLEIVAAVVGRPVSEATGVVVNPNPSLAASVIIPFALPLMLALLLWRQTSSPTAAAR
jgi:hypothetical protein